MPSSSGLGAFASDCAYGCWPWGLGRDHIGDGVVHSRGQTHKAMSCNRMKRVLSVPSTRSPQRLGSGEDVARRGMRPGSACVLQSLRRQRVVGLAQACRRARPRPGHAADRQASIRPGERQATSADSVTTCSILFYRTASKPPRQNGNSTPSVNEPSSLTASLTVSCTSARSRRSGLGRNSKPARTGNDVSVSRTVPTSKRDSSKLAPP